MRIAICHPQTPFARGGGEMHTERLASTLREMGHEVDVLAIPFKWYPPSELVHQMALWRSLDVSEANGQPIDMAIALKFPAYLVRHERKVVWLIHQHRAAYELWDHPVYGDLAMHEDGAAVRELIWKADRVGLKEAKRIYTNSANVGARLERSLGIPSEPLYHRSPICEALLRRTPGPLGDHVVFPSRLEPLKRQSLAVEAMRHVRTPVRMVLVGAGPGRDALERRIEQEAVGDRVRLESGVSDERLLELYLGSLGAYYGPYDEDYGYVTLEAMAARRPVVTTTDSGGPLELVRDGENGLVVDPAPRRIAAALDRLYADREVAARLGAEGHRTLLASVPQWREVAERLLS
ncbi:MAG TPA: glycosyltransferase family 4 protein [Actinomycetota bacterium]|nr:glycosyltransferase family 4 protein [Actinomycetota bacterium]